MTPPADQARQLIDALTSHDIDKLASRLTKAIDRDHRGGTTRPDGWPRGRADGPGSGAKITVDDEHGQPDTIPVTAVELAVIARDHPPRDRHHELVEAATRETRAAIRALDRLDGLLTGIDRLLTEDRPIDTAEPGCSSCTRFTDAIGAPHWSPRFRGDLCQWCYGWTNDTENNPSRAFPPVALIAARARGERITTAHIAAALDRKANA